MHPHLQHVHLPFQHQAPSGGACPELQSTSDASISVLHRLAKLGKMRFELVIFNKDVLGHV